MSDVLEGKCFCGSVKYELSGDVQVMGYCHCNSCREWSGDPVHAWSIWTEESVAIKEGAQLLGTYKKTPESLSHRQFCTACGGHLMIHHPELGVYDVLPGTVPSLDFAPAMHTNCIDAVMPLDDALPKYKDFPSEFEAFGGTGELMP